jgi:hypothetical protein
MERISNYWTCLECFYNKIVCFRYGVRDNREHNTIGFICHGQLGGNQFSKRKRERFRGETTKTSYIIERYRKNKKAKKDRGREAEDIKKK